MFVGLGGRRAGAKRRAACLLVAACIGGHVLAATDEFEVTSSKPEDRRGTPEEVESTLTDELAVKLRQFDEWTVESGLDIADGAPGADAFQGGPGNGAGGSQSGGAAAPGAGSEQMKLERAFAADAEAAGDIGATGDGAASEEGDGQGAAEADMTGRPGDSDGSAQGARQRSASPPGGREDGAPHEDRADRPGREDDVARMIREAAEEETDPERKRALLEQYEEYMKSR